jgi:hypothetical protein
VSCSSHLPPLAYHHLHFAALSHTVAADAGRTSRTNRPDTPCTTQNLHSGGGTQKVAQQGRQWSARRRLAASPGDRQSGPTCAAAASAPAVPSPPPQWPLTRTPCFADRLWHHTTCLRLLTSFIFTHTALRILCSPDEVSGTHKREQTHLQPSCQKNRGWSRARR